jgi:membrane-associated phospholipid phosphatase
LRSRLGRLGPGSSEVLKIGNDIRASIATEEHGSVRLGLHSEPMSSSSEVVSPRQIVVVRNGAVAVAAGFVFTALVGFIFKTGTVSDADASVFNWLVPKLQSNSFLVDSAEAVTPVATIQVGLIGGLVIGLLGMIRHRKLIWLMLPLMIMVGAQAFQNLVIDVVQRDNPIENVIGNSGGFFSGGVMRAILLAAMFVTVFWPSLGDRKTYAAASAVGLVVATSRMTLGRHWPLDVVAAFVVGIGIAAVFRTILREWAPEVTSLGK